MAYSNLDYTIATLELGNVKMSALAHYSYIEYNTAVSGTWEYYVNYVGLTINPLFDFSWALPISTTGTFTRTVHLTNGNYFIQKLVVTQSGSYFYNEFDIKLYLANDTVALSYSFTDSRIVTDCVALFGYDPDTGKIITIHQHKRTDLNYVSVYNHKTNKDYTIFENWVNGSIVPEYSWKAWTILQGNSGQYRQRLTAIKDNSIGEDISTAHYGTQNDFIFIAPNVDMVPYARNMNYNSPAIVAWSGINWMTMELQSEQGLLTDQVKAVFKLYAKNSSETTPIYQETRYFFIGSTNHFYLSFITDDEQMAGVFLPVYYTVGSSGTPFSWGNASPTESEMELIWQWLQASGSQDPEDIPDHGIPYDNGTTDNGGGGGNPIPQDDIHTPNVPALGAMASGMFTVYCPTDTQLGQISAWLWTDNFIDNIKKYFNNASDNIISFYVLPLEPDNLPTKNFKVGNLENTSITGVKYLTTRFVEVDMGSVQIEKRWETYLDFAPYTKFSVYLPGVGVQALDTDDLMCPATMDGSLPSDLGSTISLSYVIDLMTGVLVAYVKINGQIRYQFPGKMGYQIPLTGENYTRMAQGFVTAVSGIAATVATAGTAAPFAASAGAAGIVNAMKPEVYRGGNLTGDASMLSLKTPLLIRSSPNKPKLDNQEDFTGFPSYKIGNLSEFTGYIEVLDAHVEGISCTEEEREKILAALKGGVII